MTLDKLILPDDVADLVRNAKSCTIVSTEKELYDLSCPEVNENGVFEVAYDVPDVGRVVEATVVRARNGIVINYMEPYMRRRDPDCLVMADDLPTDKPRFIDRYNKEFSEVRRRTLDWLKEQDLLVYFIHAGGVITGMDGMVVLPTNTACFGFTLALLQGIIDASTLPDNYQPKAAIYVAPPFRGTDFDGKQVVVHSRGDFYEMFSFNLYPGPSAKKGVYSMLLTLGEIENWVTMHCSAVRVVTPYDTEVTMAHEGASGGGKSELLEYVHRQIDNTILIGTNTITGEEQVLDVPVNCELHPIVDDMALCHPNFRKDDRLTLFDAELAWFVRVDHILKYGTDPHLEGETINTEIPLAFLNLDTKNGSTALIWEHTMDAPGKRCPNPRVVLPRRIVPGVVNDPVAIDVRSFGIRTPPSTREQPGYAVFGLFHIIPPALAWLWRVIAPRGYANPSVIDTEGIVSEGIGSYWPFATGRMAPQANLLLDQIVNTKKILYLLIPNQHIGAWKVGFKPEWITREYIARRGSIKFHKSMVQPARCSLLGYSLKKLSIEKQAIHEFFLRPETQPELGFDGYDAGVQQLVDFCKRTVEPYLQFDDLLPMGRQIIECCLNDGSLEDYESFIPYDTFKEE
ncbi:MAG TPA: DUF4914 family protein [Candidatus Lokiarchaeia archaeon]|nr:DUF4914 family protein [Candidatus Lokiarchaeia archaeon]